MIDEALYLLKTQLNNYFASLGLQEQADFPDVDPSTGLIKFKSDTVNLLLYRIEKESAFGQQGSPVHPTMNINLNVLFVANLQDYSTGVQRLSQVIQFFQTNRSLNPQNAPEMPMELANLEIDLITFNLSEQTNLWFMLGLGYQPSVAYLVKTVTFGGQEALFRPPISTTDRHYGVSGNLLDNRGRVIGENQRGTLS